MQGEGSYKNEKLQNLLSNKSDASLKQDKEKVSLSLNSKRSQLYRGDDLSFRTARNDDFLFQEDDPEGKDERGKRLGAQDSI